MCVLNGFLEAAALREVVLRPATLSQYAPHNDFQTHPRKESEDSQGQGRVGWASSEADVQRMEHRI